MQRRDIEKLTELGLKRYIEGMTITSVLPEIEPLVEISKSAKRRLAWMDYERNCGNVAKTCRYFGISRKTFYAWQNRYRPDDLTTLEDRSRRPRRVRTWEVTREEERRVLSLRTRSIRYGKMKLAVIYRTTYGEALSSWKIQRVIRKHQLYYHPKQNALLRKKRLRNQPKKRITELKKEQRSGFLIALDTVVRYVSGQKRYILTGIDTQYRCRLQFRDMAKEFGQTKSLGIRVGENKNTRFHFQVAFQLLLQLPHHSCANLDRVL